MSSTRLVFPSKINPFESRPRWRVVLSTAIAVSVSVATLSVGIDPAGATTCTAGAGYDGGNGSPATPYEIGSRNALMRLTQQTGDWSAHFRLTADIDLTDCTNTDWSPIGNSSTPFTGTFDGRRKTISNLTYSPSSPASPVGVFGVVGATGLITDLQLTGISMTGGSQAVGSLAGELRSGAIVSSSSARLGVASGGATVSAFVGVSAGSILASYSFETVRANSSSAISGGLVGHNMGSISNSFSLSNFNCAQQCFQHVGGLIGVNAASAGTVQHTYAVSRAPSDSGHTSFGGLIGNNLDSASDITSSFYDSNTFSVTSAVGTGNAVTGAGRTTSDLKTLATFTAATFDMGTGWNITKTWGLCTSQFPRPFETSGYPFLTVFYTSSPTNDCVPSQQGGQSNNQNQNNQSQNSGPATRRASLYWTSLDTNGGTCRIDGVNVSSTIRTPYLGYRYIPSADECTRDGHAFSGWAMKTDPGTVLRFPRLIDLNGNVWRYFIADNYDLIAVWVTPGGAASIRS